MSFLDSFDDACLTSLAKERNSRVKRWVGAKSSARRRTYICYICDQLIDTESASEKPTKHAEKAILLHKLQHERD